MYLHVHHASIKPPHTINILIYVGTKLCGLQLSITSVELNMYDFKTSIQKYTAYNNRKGEIILCGQCMDAQNALFYTSH